MADEAPQDRTNLLTVKDDINIEELADALDVETRDLTKEEIIPLIKEKITTKRKAKEEEEAVAKKRRLHELYAITVNNPLFEPPPSSSIFGCYREEKVSVTIFVSDSNTVDNLKGQIQQILNISPERFFLTFNGVPLVEGTLLDNYNIRQGKDFLLIKLHCGLHQVDENSNLALLEAKQEQNRAQQLHDKIHKQTRSTAESIFAAANAAPAANPIFVAANAMPAASSRRGRGGR
jgi:hypothetical protein